MNIHSYKEIRKTKLSAQERRRSRVLTDRALAQMELAELREALRVTQVDLAKRLRVTQATLSRLERGRDPKFTTLRNFVRALGGRLEVRAVFSDRVVTLRHLGE